MADDDQQMPDFAAVTGDLNEVSRAHVSLAAHFERMRDIPAFDAGARILAAIATLAQNVNARFDLVDTRFDLMDSRLDSM